jgi:hypothetical protein
MKMAGCHVDRERRKGTGAPSHLGEIQVEIGSRCIFEAQQVLNRSKCAPSSTKAALAAASTVSATMPNPGLDGDDLTELKALMERNAEAMKKLQELIDGLQRTLLTIGTSCP